MSRTLHSPGTVVAIHDTSRRRCDGQGVADPETAHFWSEIERVIARHGLVERLELPLSRGLLLLRIDGD